MDSIDYYAIILFQTLAHSSFFNSPSYNRNATYKYVPYMPNNKYTNIFHIYI